MIKILQTGKKGSPGHKVLPAAGPHPLTIRPCLWKTLTFTVMLMFIDAEVLGKLDSSHSMTGAFTG